MKSKLFWIFVTLSLTLLFPPASLGQKSDISGKITNKGQPIQGAKVRLQSFDDESCVKLAKASKLSDEEKATLDKCSRDVAAFVANNKGEYRFPNVPAGWYKLLVEWTLDGPPALRFTVQWQGEFVITYFETKTEPKKYSALAQGEIFSFDGVKSQTKDFNWLNSPDLNVP